MKSAAFPRSLYYSSTFHIFLSKDGMIKKPRHFTKKNSGTSIMPLFIIIRYDNPVTGYLTIDCLCFISNDNVPQFCRHFVKLAFADLTIPTDGVFSIAEIDEPLICAVIK